MAMRSLSGAMRPCWGPRTWATLSAPTGSAMPSLTYDIYCHSARSVDAQRSLASQSMVD